MSTPLEPPVIYGYHAHVYFSSPAEEEHAGRLREEIARRFAAVRVGRWHHKPVGPHSRPMYQLAFEADQLPQLLPWLLGCRGELSILLHPVTDDEYAEHAYHAAWLGNALPLRLEYLR